MGLAWCWAAVLRDTVLGCVRRLSRTLAWGQAAERRNLGPAEPCLSQPLKRMGAEAGRARRQLFPFFLQQLPALPGLPGARIPHPVPGWMWNLTLLITLLK